ncbi:MAG: DUF4082 domain-containing protein [Fimbriimonadaceae bacterium]|nr:DUF4082 domain-containing protein [Fimbriimonadaceae bacterium]
MKRTLILAMASLAGTASAFNAVDFDPNSGNTGGNNDQSVGWQFDVVNSITVTHLTWFDADLDGLSARHEIGIWDPNGNLLVSGIMPAGTSANLDGIWRQLDVADTVLSVGTGYIVGGFNGANQSDRLAFNVNQSVNANITFIDATFSGINGIFERPTNFSSAVNGFYGPSFQAVPEPATMIALAAGLAALAARRRRQ